ncbi:uncharacterized protein METZ01_LOCUS428624, partial [marine metagenome]
MKTKRLMRSFLKVAMTAFLVFFTGSAFAIENSTSIVSPYWQVDSGSYSFIAVSHSSLSGMNSQIGIKVTALDHSTDGEYGTAQSFTINSGATRRIFIVPTSHTTLNPTSLTDSDVTFIRGTNNYSYGSIRVQPIANPISHKYLERDPSNTSAGTANGNGEGFRDATMLTYWGSIVVEAQTTGFAMEFIGDMNDSSSSSINGKHCQDADLKSATAQ